jgi:hypothetical protein
MFQKNLTVLPRYRIALVFPFGVTKNLTVLPRYRIALMFPFGVTLSVAKGLSLARRPDASLPSA